MAQGGHRKVGLVIAGNFLELTRVQDLVDRDFAAQAADELWIAGHHLHPDVGWFPVSGRRHRRLEPTRGRLGDGLASAHRVGARCPQHGISTTTPKRHPEDEIVALVELGLDGVDSLIDDPKEAVTWL